MSMLGFLKNKLDREERYSLSFMRMFFWDINWIKTIWFNFKALPFSQAKKIPFIISYNTKIKNIGKIVLPHRVHTGMVSIGVFKLIGFESNDLQTVFNNRGTFSVAGNMKIHPGTKVVVRSGATLEVGERVLFGGNGKVICYKNIKIGNDFRISWNSQIFDTDFHFMYNLEKQCYYSRLRPVIIGNNVFVGNSSTLGKGTVLPDGCVVSCVSKLSGDFSSEGENLLISGNPAKVVKKGVQMSNSWLIDKEDEIARLMEE